MRARWKNSMSFGFAPGQPAFDEVHAEQVELLGDAELVVDGRGDALDLEAVAECGVEDFDESHVVGSCRSAVRACAVCRSSEVRAAVDFNAAAQPGVPRHELQACKMWTAL